ncbi:MAG: hypothetical protein AEth_01720 [Candidatus Argoarchaeum ethanivorans]|uniref:Uncharacterized protein n=1 Tax=Candidatus Argoarchaeum ethanivorans TaxID=2608793 RepID=A0A8B3S1J2_9EURY|nr:MAG: hypothetical protein AEth_01720 [Candidatus Argoarchaeum ethanivorans]
MILSCRLKCLWPQVKFDKTCAHEASQGHIIAQLDKHTYHRSVCMEDEAEDENNSVWLAEQRTREHVQKRSETAAFVS